MGESEAYAIYAELSYRFTDRFEASLGGRYFNDEQKQLTTNREDTFDTFNPRLNLAYTLQNDGLVYFNVAKGFRSGGFNQTALPPPLPQPPPTYGPEDLWTYELGYKSQLMDGRITLELAGYYNDWSDVQAATAGFEPFLVITNTGQISGPGLDVTLSALLTEGPDGNGDFGSEWYGI